MNAPRNNIEALTKAIALTITAPTQEERNQAKEMVGSFAAGLSQIVIEHCKEQGETLAAQLALSSAVKPPQIECFAPHAGRHVYRRTRPGRPASDRTPIKVSFTHGVSQAQQAYADTVWAGLSAEDAKVAAFVIAVARAIETSIRAAHCS